MRQVFFAVFLAFAVFSLSAQEKRLALVIGNSAYDSVPLANPVHDAQDMALMLKDAGYEVLVKTDADLREMEAVLDEYQKKLKGMDSTVVFYAGHGVQVQGENYLIPVREDIRSEASVRSRAVALADVLDRIRQSGVGTALLFLDCCRDNPFSGSSRGGSRGLSVQAVPRELETLIAYATEPGDTAQDGSGRNGVFTAALLKNLGQGGLKLSEAMTQVKADVRSFTGGKQRPRVDDGLAHSYYVFDPLLLSQKTSQQARQSALELAAMDAQLAELGAKIKASQDEAARQSLELEQQKQWALQKAKKLEAENLAREAERQKKSAETAALEVQKRKDDEKTTRLRQDELARQAALKRQQIDLLNLASTEKPDELIAQIEKIDAALAEIVSKYDEIWARTAMEVSRPYEKKWDELVKQGPDPIETDQEFAQRLALEKKKLDEDKQNELLNRLKTHQAEQDAQAGDLRAQFRETLGKLESSVWFLSGKSAQVQAGSWDRNARLWPVTLVSQDAALPFQWQVFVDFNALDAATLKSRYTAFDTAVKTSALALELNWKIRREKGRYAVDLVAAVLKDLTSGTVFWKTENRVTLAYFTAGKRNSPQKAPRVTFLSSPEKERAEIWMGGRKLGVTPFTALLADGSAVFEARWADGSFVAKTAFLTTDTQPQLSFDKPFMQMLPVPGGNFVMGDPSGKERDFPRIPLRVSAFQMARSPVTVAQFKSFVQETGYVSEAESSSFAGGRVFEDNYWTSESDANWKSPYLKQNDNHPVVLVTWRDALQFCNWLSKKEGKTPAYVFDGKEWSWNREADGYRLPTSVEWEFAARGGKDGAKTLLKFAGSDTLADVAWFSLNSGNSTHPVNQKAPNSLGLYDLCGNVRQWCWDWDWYWDYIKGLLKASDPVDPAGPESGMNTHIIRGGGWYGNDFNQQLFYYSYSSDSIRSNDLGFRVVLPAVR